VPQTKWWKLKEEESAQTFKERVLDEGPCFFIVILFFSTFVFIYGFFAPVSFISNLYPNLLETKRLCCCLFEKITSLLILLRDTLPLLFLAPSHGWDILLVKQGLLSTLLYAN
jgi:hypothetical protein